MAGPRRTLLRIEYRVSDELPRLAWCAGLDQGSEVLHVNHGVWVETSSRFFVEGAWDGSFSDGSLADSNCIHGTGALVCEDTAIFVTPSTNTDYLFWQQAGSRIIVSNSLPVLLAAIGDELDPAFLHYHEINDSIRLGVERYTKVIPTRKGAVNRLIYSNLRVSADSVAETHKPQEPSFSCFGGYYEYLRDRYARITQNLRDPARSHRWRIHSTQSRGYDTTAINTLARDYGIDQVFTVTRSKGRYAYADRDQATERDDDGSQICDALGLACVPIDRRAFERGFPEEPLFYSSIHSREDANLLKIIEWIHHPCLLLTGTHGEIWYPKAIHDQHPGSLNGDFVRWDLGCHGLSEVRLQAGFVQLPVPYIGARRRVDLIRITESAEMDPWRLGTSYDRPIARRIAEAAGVPRPFFGQAKLASVTLSASPTVPYNADLRREFFDFLVRERLLHRWQIKFFPLVHRINTSITYRHRNRLIYYFEAAIPKISGRNMQVPFIWQRLNGSIYCFCVNKRAREYAMRLPQFESA